MADYTTPGTIQAEASSKEATVETPTLAYNRMADHWDLLDALMGGTEAMQQAGPTYLPQEELETAEEYNKRLYRSTLHPAFSKTVQDLALKPFQKDLKLKDGLPAGLKDLTAKADAQGRSLSVFASDVMKQGVLKGITYIFVDYPRLTQDVKTLADQRAAGIAPYMCLIPACDVIEVLYHQEGDRIILDRVRIKETTTEAVGEWGQTEVTRIRVWYPLKWELYEFKEDARGKETWVITDSGDNSLGVIPLVPFITKAVGNFEALPPLEELAFLNLKHWRVQSDQDNVLHIASVPVLFGRGFDLETDTIAIGASKGVMSNNPSAELKWVEHSGTAVKAADDQLTKLERMMAILGFEPLILLPVAPTATEVATNEAQSQSAIQAWIGYLETALEQALRFAAMWLGIDVTDEQIQVEIYRDFGFSRNEVTQLDFLFKTWQLAGITLESWLMELKRRGMLRDDFNVQKELQKVDDENNAIINSTTPVPNKPGLEIAPSPNPEPQGGLGDQNSPLGKAGQKKTLTPVGAENV